MDSEPAQFSSSTVLGKPVALATSANYVALVAIWSTTPLAVVLSLHGLHPLWALASRLYLALVLGLLLLGLMKKPLPLSRNAMKSYAMASLGVFWAMLFTYMGAAYLPSGVVSILFGLAPLITGVVGHVLFKTQRLAMLQWFGMLLAVIGLMVIFGEAHGSTHMLKGMLYVLLGVGFYVASIFALQRQSIVLHPLQQTVGALMLSCIVLLGILPFFWQQRPVVMPAMNTVLAVVYSASFATIIAMGCYFYLVQRVKATTLALTTVMTPVFALMLGAVFNQEHLALMAYAGIMLVIVGLLVYFKTSEVA